jgi:hypothetical protein
MSGAFATLAANAAYVKYLQARRGLSARHIPRRLQRAPQRSS